MISTLRLLARSLLFYCAITIQAYAQSYDGTYSGTIACDPIPGVTAGPLKTLFTMRVAGDVITYEREVIRPTGEAPLGITETGRGSITAERELILTGTAKGRTFHSDATYRGKFTGDAIRLTGAQVWTYAEKPTPHTRPCTVELTKSK